MHNIQKIKMFRVLLWITYFPSWLILKPIIHLKKKRQGNLFFFFDRYVMGGAQKVHLDILESVKDVNKMVFFTRNSNTKNYYVKTKFYSQPNTYSKDIHLFCDNLIFRIFAVHYFSFYINRHPNATVLSSNSTFFYDMLPFLKKKIYKIELLHNFTYNQNGMEFFGLCNYKNLDKRLVIDSITLENIRLQYQEYNINPQYIKKVELIEFGVDVPDSYIKDLNLPLRILYAGRGGPQKRIWLINKIAEYYLAKRNLVEFHFAGTMLNELSLDVKNNSIIHGEIGDKKELNEIFTKANILLLTSAYEGFPMVIKECMAYGCIPVVTALPGNKTHLKNMVNSLFIESIIDESMVVDEGIKNINFLINNPDIAMKLSKNSYEYAKNQFSKGFFMKRYRELLIRK